MAAEHLVDLANCSKVEVIVATIRGMYNKTNSGAYVIKGKQTVRRINKEDYVIRTNASTGDALLDLIMQTYGYRTYALEFYYDNPDYDGKVISGNSGPNFVYAVIDGKEYRYYFKENSLIRRIGPDGTISDNPKTNEFLNLIYQVGCYYQKDISDYSSARNLKLESIAFGQNYYDMQDKIIVQAGIVESFENGENENCIFVIDANTQVSGKIREEVTWRSEDNGYTWMKRYFETSVAEGGI